MPFEHSVPMSAPLFAGDAAVFRYQILKAGESRTNPHALMEDITDWLFSWSLRKAVNRVDPYRQAGLLAIPKTMGVGIQIGGTFNIDRALNTQRIYVGVTAADTAALVGGLYVHAVKRVDGGLDKVAGYGTVPVFARVVA